MPDLVRYAKQEVPILLIRKPRLRLPVHKTERTVQRAFHHHFRPQVAAQFVEFVGRIVLPACLRKISNEQCVSVRHDHPTVVIRKIGRPALADRRMAPSYLHDLVGPSRRVDVHKVPVFDLEVFDAQLERRSNFLGRRSVRFRKDPVELIRRVCIR